MNGMSRLGAGAALWVALGIIGAPLVTASETLLQADAPLFNTDAILVRFDPGAAASERAAARAAVGASLDVRYTIVPGLERLKVGRGRSVEKTIDALWRNPNVIYAEPDYELQALAEPNDPRFASLWGMANIKAPDAWDVTTGSASVTVAVIDTGIDRNHPDLQANIWMNPDEIDGNGIDDDNNGYVDDVYGWDFAYSDNDPSDIHGHGTHVAGTIGAVGNNSVGVVGVNWQVRLVALKFLDDNGDGYTSNAVLALQYAHEKGIPISNNSWGGGSYSWSLYDAIHSLQADGHLFVAAAGNDSYNNDAWPHYPSSYDLGNIIAVASINSSDERSSFSNYGATSVDLGAPGSSILSTTPNGGYQTYNGTSMASPHVAGAAALLLSHHADWTYGQLREALLSTARPISALEGITVTGATLDVLAALTTAIEFAEFELSPSALDFGDQAVGTTSVAQSVTMTNTGSVEVRIESIVLAADESGHYASSTDCGSALAVGATCDISIVFSPTTKGPKTATLIVSGERGAGSRKVAVSGVAITPEYSVTPLSLDFGAQAVGGSTAPQIVTITNTGTLDLPITRIYSSTSRFSISHDCGSLLTVGSSCSISVAFSPTSGGAVQGVLYVYGGAGAETKTVALTGFGLVPEFILSPTSLEFGVQAVGGTSASQTVTLMNTGLLPLPITSITSYYQFNITHDCGTTVAVGSDCTITVSFSPSYAGDTSGYLYVYGGNGAQTRSVRLSGTGLVPTYTLSVDTLDFGEQAVGRTSAPQTIVLTNTGSLDLPISSIGSGLSRFSATHDCGSSVASGATCTISVTFSPTYAGTRTEYLYVYGGNGAATKYVRLLGTGLVPTFSLSVGELHFREQAVGETSAPQTIVLTNTGSLDLPISSIGSGLSRFSATHDCGLSVASGATCTISVTFSPTYAGTRTEYLYVYVGGGAQYRYVRLTGTGVTPLSGHEPGSLSIPASDTDGTYLVSWGASSRSGVTYVLEEATNPSFTTGVRVAYQGPDLSAPISGRVGLTYYYRVKSKLVGYTDSAWVTGGNGCVVTFPLASSVMLTPSVTSPATVGMPVTFTATASGGSGSYEYMFLLRAPGGTLNPVQAYSSTPTWTWNTTSESAGTYQVVVRARNAGSTRSYETYQATSYALVFPPASSVTVTPSVTSPATVGMPVTFTAAASGGSGSYEYMFLLRLPGGTLDPVRAYSSTPTWTWNTTSESAGTYQIVVRARNTGSTRSYETYQAISYGLVSPATGVNLTPSPISPATLGTPVTFTAAASGGSGSYEYMFLLRLPGGTLDPVQAYSSTPTWSWNTTGATTGTYQIVVRARNAGSTRSYETYQAISYSLIHAPVSSVTLTPSPAAPVTVGTAVTFTATAGGGSGSYEYMFLLRLPGGTLDPVQAYSSTPTWTWNTTSESAGTYQIVVRARNAGSTKSYETYQATSYTLSP